MALRVNNAVNEIESIQLSEESQLAPINAAIRMQGFIADVRIRAAVQS